MQAINQTIIQLQDQIQSLDASAPSSGKQLSAAIILAQQVTHETRVLAHTINNHVFADFVRANDVILNQLANSALTADVNNTVLTQSGEVIHQLTSMYQEALVPMLTRLNNLSEQDETQKITSITALGNELITYGSQINQFNEKITINEKICTMFGIVLMLSSASMMAAILTTRTETIPLITPIVMLALGCNVCKKAIAAHTADPGADLLVTSLKKMEPLIYDVSKSFASTQQSTVKNILQPQSANVATEVAPTHVVAKPKAAKPAPAPTPTLQQEPAIPPSAESANIFDKLKGVLDDLFSIKK